MSDMENLTTEPDNPQDYVALLLWNLLTYWRHYREHPPQSADAFVKDLTNAVSADLCVAVDIRMIEKWQAPREPLTPTAIYFRPKKTAELPGAVLEAASIKIIYLESLFALGANRLQIFTDVPVSNFLTIPMAGRGMFLRNRVSLNSGNIFAFLGWLNCENVAATVHQYTGQVSELLSVLATGQAGQQEYDNIAEALDQWARVHSHPGEPVLITGENSYTPEALADEVRSGTELGKNLRMRILELATEQILGKRKRS